MYTSDVGATGAVATSSPLDQLSLDPNSAAARSGACAAQAPLIGSNAIFSDRNANAPAMSGDALDQSGGAVCVFDAYRQGIAAAGRASAQNAIGGQPAAPTAAADKSGSSLTADLGKAWDWTKNEAASAANGIGSFDAAHGHVLTRLAGAAQAVGGAAESVAGAAVMGVGGASTATGVGAAPGIPAMIGGGALAVNGADNAAAGLQTLWTGEFHHTLISQAAGAGAAALGASDQTAQRITNGVDISQGLVGGGASAAVGIFRKGASAGIDLSEVARTEQAAQTVARADSAAAPAAVNSASAAAPNGKAYSVAFQTKLDAASYPGVSRGAHFQEANQALLDATQADADFAASMKDLGVNVQKTPTGLAPRSSPADWTWHHAQEPGVMQLVPRAQHAPGSIFQDALHPNGSGGYALWGK